MPMIPVKSALLCCLQSALDVKALPKRILYSHGWVVSRVLHVLLLSNEIYAKHFFPRVHSEILHYFDRFQRREHNSSSIACSFSFCYFDPLGNGLQFFFVFIHPKCENVVMSFDCITEQAPIIGFTPFHFTWSCSILKTVLYLLFIEHGKLQDQNGR